MACDTEGMREVEKRFEVAVELHRTGVLLMEQNLRRRHPDEPDEAIERRMAAWLRARPGAEHGDGPQPVD